MALKPFMSSSALLLFILASAQSQPSCGIGSAEDSECATAESTDANIMMQGHLKVDMGMQREQVGSSSHALNLEDTAQPQCEDTPGWKNGLLRKSGCAKYALHYCSNGAANSGKGWALGSTYNFPERNCCICGKAAQAASSKYEVEGQGWCRNGQVYASRAWALASSSGGLKGFDTPQYKSWINEAWLRCLTRNANVKVVSVWKDAGYRCYTASNCSPNGAPNAKSWRPHLMEARSYVAVGSSLHYNCPERTVQLKTSQDCQKAASALRFGYEGEVTRNFYPSGCLIMVAGKGLTGKVFFNADPTDNNCCNYKYKSVCEKAAIVTVTSNAQFYQRYGARWIADAACPHGYWIQACSSYPVNFEDGLNYDHGGCAAISKGNSQLRFSPEDIKASVTCSRTQKTSVVTSSKTCGVNCHGGFESGVVRAKCTGDRKALWCYCWSMWGHCSQTAWAPRRGQCKMKVGAGKVKLWAICAKEKCSGKYVLETGDNLGDETCLKDCPPGYIKVPAVRGKPGGTCAVCQGWTSRRRNIVCNKCPNGKVSRGGSDDCQNIQEHCDDLCPCQKCLQKIETKLKGCVGANNKYHPGTSWCPAVVEGTMQCKMYSVGCYYKLLCSARCIDPAWKAVFCGGKTVEEPCPSDASAIQQIAQENETLLGADAPVSLDESMSMKKTCR